jgi:isopenicillin N synthase-like dioxygenase
MASQTLNSFNIQKISFTGENSSSQLVKSLHETGFAVISDHPITGERINEFYAAWGKFFASDSKMDWKFDPKTQVRRGDR